ncbi:high affinity immunoglobulin epsilon receptor subunit beta-like [Phyllobates terribilis]|uniref:high affinity immunoglobulin epsilon receptor subunit beta-like n=1 Tax=Phyllobates terribilis TaxID=111132 RepID=UPI003CCA95C1
MSIQMNDVTMQNQDFVHYPPPQYDDIPAILMGNVSAIPAPQHLLNECTQPPAYDTLSELPIWIIPLPDSDRSFNVEHWNTDSQIPLHSMSLSPQYQRSNAVTSQTSETPLFYYKFWKSPPAIVGVLMLVASFVQVFTGTVLASSNVAIYSQSLTYGIPFWAPVCFLITGCLSIIVHFKPLRIQIRNSLIFNILTTIISPVGLVYNVIDLENLWTFQYPQNWISESKFYYILISTNVALLCLSIPAGIFGSCALCHSSRKDPQESVIENGFISPTLPSDLPQSQLHSPPPYTPRGITTQ